MTRLAFVDSPVAITAARHHDSAARLVTDNPLLAAADGAVVNLDAAMTDDEAFALGEKGVVIALGLDEALRADFARRAGLDPAALRLAGHTSRLLCSLLYRAAILAKAKRQMLPRAVAAFVVPAPAHEPAAPTLMSRFAAPIVPLIDAGFFSECATEILRIPVALPTRINDTAINDHGRRLAMLPLPVLVYEAARRFGLAAGFAGRAITVVGENEAMRETFPWLLLSRFRLRRLGRLAAIVPFDAATHGSDESQIADLRSWIEARLLRDGLDFDVEERQAIAAVAARHVEAGLRWLKLNETALVPAIERMAKGGSPRLLLTNGLTGPLGALTYELCRRHGITAVGFEHGVTKGISRLAESRVDASEGQNADAFLACAPNVARSFADRIARGALAFHPIGLPDHVRRLLRPRLQRRLARQHLGIAADRCVVMHVSTWPYHGNHRSGPGVPTETQTFERDRRALLDVYSKMTHHVVFKQYPTQRFPHEPDYAEMFDGLDGVQFVKDEDFRYVRAAADILVTGNPTSTLGWCIGTGVPIVWLDSDLVTPLIDRAMRARFAAAFIPVDTDQPD